MVDLYFKQLIVLHFLAREERNNIVRFSTDEGKVIEISSNSPEVGKVEELVEAIDVTGEDLKISFSAKYMMDALKAIDGQDVEIQFTGAMRPFILKSVDDDSILATYSSCYEHIKH